MLKTDRSLTNEKSKKSAMVAVLPARNIVLLSTAKNFSKLIRHP